jgi:hypothetical protein
MTSGPHSATVYKERQICCTAKKDDEHWAAVNEAASASNGDPPVHDYSGEDEWLNNVFIGAFRVSISRASIHIVVDGYKDKRTVRKRLITFKSENNYPLQLTGIFASIYIQMKRRRSHICTHIWLNFWSLIQIIYQERSHFLYVVLALENSCCRIIKSRVKYFFQPPTRIEVRFSTFNYETG